MLTGERRTQSCRWGPGCQAAALLSASHPGLDWKAPFSYMDSGFRISRPFQGAFQRERCPLSRNKDHSLVLGSGVLAEETNKNTVVTGE